MHPTSMVPPWETAAQQVPKTEAAFLKVKTASWVGGRGRRRDGGSKLNNGITETKVGWKLKCFI